jgi:hypothetical protein
MSVKRLLKEFDSPELTEWYQHFQEEPWPWERADAQAALVASTVHNASGNYRVGARVDDYLLRFGMPAADGVDEAKKIEGWKCFFALVRRGRSRG